MPELRHQVFSISIATRSSARNARRCFQALPVARSSARAAPVVRDEVDPEAEAQGAELVSLEDAEPGEKVEAVAEEDIEVEDAPADDTFLEEEEEDDDDVATLIDGDIENDEEG